MTIKHLTVATVAICLMAAAPAQAFLIDDFNTLQTVAQTGVGSNGAGIATPGAVGGARYTQATVTAGAGALDLGSDFPINGAFSHSQASGVTGNSLLQWDGDSNSTLGFGLGGVDLTDAGASTGIVIRLLQTDFPVNITINVFENASDYSSTTVVVPFLAMNVDFFIDFASFIPTGAGADFTSVEAINLTINDATGFANADVAIDFIESTSIPEAGILAIFGLGLIGVAAARRRNARS